MTLHDGNGWVECRCGQRHWGRHGAAGLLLARSVAGRARHGRDGRPGATPDTPVFVEPEAAVEVLLQLRAGWTHQGGRWALPGGARDSHEDVVAAALREAREETGVVEADLFVVGQHPGVDHVDWSYTYVLALARRPVTPTARTEESDDLRWLELGAVESLPLLPAFGSVWPALRVTLINALGTRRSTTP
ncbi:MAG TPA: NUDIX hydrolase [Kineosporiaceae bacterium]